MTEHSPDSVTAASRHTMHDYPMRGEPTSCCGRTVNELPLGEGRTTDAASVTCDGIFTPAIYAHALYPDPGDNPNNPPKLADAVKYHAARALALMPRDIELPGHMDRVSYALAERAVAWHVAALARGLSGQEAMDWVHNYDSDETNECLYELCEEVGVELDRIKPYAIQRQEAGQ